MTKQKDPLPPYEPKPQPKEMQLARDYAAAVVDVCTLKDEVKAAIAEEEAARSMRKDAELRLAQARNTMKAVNDELTKLVSQ